MPGGYDLSTLHVLGACAGHMDTGSGRRLFVGRAPGDRDKCREVRAMRPTPS